MSVSSRWIARVVAAALFAGAPFLFTSSCDLCGNEKLAEYPSPDGTLKVVVFQRSCGATTDFSTQASIVRARAEMPWGSGNLFVADTSHGDAPSGAGGGPELRVRWIDDRTVELSRHARARVSKSEDAVVGVRARYVTFE